jgi:hypothetical protein
MLTPLIAVVTFDHFSPFHCAILCLIFGNILAELVGFKHSTSLRNHFRARFAISPSEWRRSFRGNNP